MATIKGQGVRVTGLNESLRALKRAGEAEKLGLLKHVFHQAAQHVVNTARGKASTRMESAAASVLRASKTQRRAQILFNERRGFEHGAEFGAHRNVLRRRKTGSYLGFNQFREPRRDGYFLFPAIRQETPRLSAEVGDEIVKIFEKG